MKLGFLTNIFKRVSKVQSPPPAGKHIYPRYLYHVTSAENARRIESDGVLIAANEGMMKEAIFLFDMENFLKFWKLRTKKYNYKPLKNALIDRVAGESGDIAIFRIDTSKLDKDVLRIRSQDYIFEPGRLNWFKDTFRARGCCDKFSKKEKARFAHYLCGENANKANLYKQRKESIEYIYPFDILRGSFEKIGEATVKGKTSENEIDAFVVMKKLLEGKPEQKSVERFLCPRKAREGT